MAVFNSEIQQELERLGAKQKKPISFEEMMDCSWHTSQKTDWQKNDPQGELTDVSDFYKHFFALRWPLRLTYLDDDDVERTVRMSSPSENYDYLIKGKRTLLYIFAYDEHFQSFFSFDLFDSSDDPKVYYFAHDDISYATVRFGTVHEFLRTLQKPL